MHKILFHVPFLNQNSGAAPDHLYNLVDIIGSNLERVNFLKKLQNYNVGKKVNYKTIKQAKLIVV